MTWILLNLSPVPLPFRLPNLSVALPVFVLALPQSWARSQFTPALSDPGPSALGPCSCGRKAGLSAVKNKHEYKLSFGKLNLSCDVIVVSHLSHQVIVFE